MFDLKIEKASFDIPVQSASFVLPGESREDFLLQGTYVPIARQEEWKNFYEFPLPTPETPILPTGIGTADIDAPMPLVEAAGEVQTGISTIQVPVPLIEAGIYIETADLYVPVPLVIAGDYTGTSDFWVPVPSIEASGLTGNIGTMSILVPASLVVAGDYFGRASILVPVPRVEAGTYFTLYWTLPSDTDVVGIRVRSLKAPAVPDYTTPYDSLGRVAYTPLPLAHTPVLSGTINFMVTSVDDEGVESLILTGSVTY